MTAAANRRLTEELWQPEDLAAPGSPRTEHHRVVTAGGQLSVVPTHDPRAAAASMIRWSDATGPRDITARAAAWAAFRCGLGARFVGEQIGVRTSGSGSEPTLHEHLAAALHVSRVHLSITFGSVRPNRKPVVRVHRPGGATLAYAKVGWNTLTDRLVTAEATFLASVDRSRIGTLRIPSVIDIGTWRGHPVLVLNALPCGPHLRTAPPPGADRLETVAELAPVTRAALRDSDYWAEIDERTGVLSGAHGVADLHDLLRHRGDESLRFGRWHGDWTPWNMCHAGGSLAVWDWERTGTGVPVGLDALHYHFQRRLRRSAGAPARDRLRAATLDSTEVLRRLGVESVTTYAGLYALEMLHRFGPQSTVDWLPELVSSAAALLAADE